MSTPYLDEAERCTTVALLHEGRVLASDDPRSLRDIIRGRMVEVITRDPAAADIVRRLPGVADVQVFGERLHVTLQEGPSDAGPVSRFMASLGETPLAAAPARAVEPSLEDVFIARLSAEESTRA
jgi:ABC-2 type transport system ATP-binding protein